MPSAPSSPNVTVEEMRDIARQEARELYERLPAPRPPQGRSWKHDYAKIAAVDLDVARPASIPPEVTGAAGCIVAPFAQARIEHTELFAKAYGRAVGNPDDKFAALILACQEDGVFVHVPAGKILEQPIVLTPAAADAFPAILVSLGEGAQATVIEESTANGTHQMRVALSEVVLDDRAQLTYVALQGGTERRFTTRRAWCGAGARMHWALAESDSALSRSTVRSILAKPGASGDLTALFFCTGDQHVDLATEVDHAVESTTSETIVKSVATDRGQGRYVGNILIRQGAHGAEASLRDDGLLLSKQAHLDAIPALEISANDVKAYHGAAVGSLDEEALFYASSRGIPPNLAERLITLGFFEPAIARFPGEELRERLRAMLAAKLP